MKYIFFNGKILTQNDDAPIAEVVLINNNRIEYVGSYQDLPNIDDYKKIDLNGKVLLPGFIDTHIHFHEYIKRKNHIDLSKIITIEELKIKLTNINIKNRVSIKCFGLKISLFNKKNLNKYFLDSIIKDIPLIIMSSDYHTLLSNSKMIDMAIQNLSKCVVPSLLENIDGYFSKDYKVIIDNFPQDEICQNNIDTTIEEFQRLGITTIEEMAFSYMDFDFYDKVSFKDKIRVVRNFPEELLDYIIFEKNKKNQEKRSILRRSTEWSRSKFTLVNDESIFLTKKFKIFKVFGGLKLFYDGSLGSRTALLSKNYQEDIENKGIRVREQNEFYQIVEKAIKNNISVITHAIGDKAIKEVVDIYCAIDKKYTHKKRDYILRVEHVQHIDNQTIEKIKNNNIYVTMQPTHLRGDIDTINDIKWIKELSYRFNSLKKAGVTIGFSSDAPIETINPFLGIYSAITHSDYKINKNNRVLNPHEVITVEEAVKSYTIDAAKLSNNQESIGSIEVGKLADLIVIDNYKKKDKSFWLTIKNHLTMLGGKIVFRD